MVSKLTTIISKYDSIPAEIQSTLTEICAMCEKEEATENGNIAYAKIPFTTFMSLVSGHDNVTASGFRPQ